MSVLTTVAAPAFILLWLTYWGTNMQVWQNNRVRGDILHIANGTLDHLNYELDQHSKKKYYYYIYFDIFSSPYRLGWLFRNYFTYHACPLKDLIFKHNFFAILVIRCYQNWKQLYFARFVPFPFPYSQGAENSFLSTVLILSLNKMTDEERMFPRHLDNVKCKIYSPFHLSVSIFPD